MTQVYLKVVGIRNYLVNGEDDFPALFNRLPIGSTVFLSKEPTGSSFPGSVSVWDDSNHQIGNISKTERRYIELEISEGEMLPVKISGHSAENKCLYIIAKNTKGYKDPYIRQIPLTDGETTFSLTEHDKKLIQLTSMMKAKLKMLEDGQATDTDSLMRTANEYVKYCCTSLDGETSFSREDILQSIKFLGERYSELQDVYSSIYEQHKDICRKNNDIKTKTFLDQYNRIKDNALYVNDNKHSQWDDYLEKLKFSNDSKITKEIIDAEIKHLSELLANEMMNKYTENTETREKFAVALYSLNYSMSSIYRLYTRMIKLDYLRQLRDTDNNTEVHFPFTKKTSGSELAVLLAAMIAARKYEYKGRKEFINYLQNLHPDLIDNQLVETYLSRINDKLQGKNITTVKDQGSLLEFVNGLYQQPSKQVAMRKLATSLFLYYNQN